MGTVRAHASVTTSAPPCHCGDCLSCEVQAMRRRSLARRGKRAVASGVGCDPVTEYQALQMIHRGFVVRAEPGRQGTMSDISKRQAIKLRDGER